MYLFSNGNNNSFNTGVPAAAQRDQWQRWSPGMQVQFPAWQRGLRAWHCCCCGIGSNCSSNVIPGLGTPYAVGQPKKKRKNLQCLLNLNNMPCTVLSAFHRLFPFILILAMEMLIYLFPFYCRENCTPKKLDNLPKGPWLINGRAGMRTQVIWLQKDTR